MAKKVGRYSEAGLLLMVAGLTQREVGEAAGYSVTPVGKSKTGQTAGGVYVGDQLGGQVPLQPRTVDAIRQLGGDELADAVVEAVRG